MTDPIRIEIDTTEVRAAFARLVAAGRDPQPALAEIGEDVAESTRGRFVTQTGPDGQRWAPNTQTTLLRYLAAKTGIRDKQGRHAGTRKGYFGKDGRVTQKGAQVVSGKRILQGLSGSLASQIGYQLAPGMVVIGSSMIYAGMMQFGGTKAEFPHLWGDIPARPFIGLSADDERNILDILARHLEQAI
ncbi:MAG: phage virion morphogenesis protein [Piscinibacter sp.]|nr:phage virion morphogenesis protein [Piscinibacter sp.]MBP6636080.1 phage virion morphogenesis protein [Sulfuritalea sp.]